MKTRYRLMRRGRRGGGCYCVDTKTGKRTSLGTRDEAAAREIVAARNQAERQPVLNLQIAKAYLAGSDHGITTRTWQQAADALVTTKRGANKERWLRALQDRALVPLLPKVIIETPGDLLLRVLHLGTVSTNVFLRRLHNFCADMNWLPWPLIPKRQWPVLRFKEKRAIGFFRAKTRAAQIIRFGAELAGVLRGLPASGPLFPRLALTNERHRASLFQRSCARVGVVGVSLHSYRYAARGLAPGLHRQRRARGAADGLPVRAPPRQLRAVLVRHAQGRRVARRAERGNRHRTHLDEHFLRAKCKNCFLQSEIKNPLTACSSQASDVTSLHETQHDGP